MVGVLAQSGKLDDPNNGDPFRRQGLFQGPMILRFMWDPEVRPYLFLVCFSFSFICMCHVTANYFHYLEGLFIKGNVDDGEIHHHWDKFIPQVSVVCKWISSIEGVRRGSLIRTDASDGPFVQPSSCNLPAPEKSLLRPRRIEAPGSPRPKSP